MTDKHGTYVGLDMSGSQTRCLIVAADGPRLRYLGCGSMPPAYGTGENGPEAPLTADCVLEVVCEAEREAGLTVVSAVVGVGGSRVQSSLVSSRIRLPVGRELIENRDLADVVWRAARAATNGSTTVLQLVPLEFAVDGRGGLRNPVGLAARRLEALVRVISMANADHDIVTSLVNQASFRVEETVLSAFAAAYSTLTPSEYANGVAHLDFGKSSSGLVAYCSGALALARSIPVGHDHWVNDVSRAFGTDRAVASSLIADFGRAVHADAMNGVSIFVPQPEPGSSGQHGTLWPRNMLDKIIALRIEECMTLVRDSLLRDGVRPGDVQSLVLTGDVATIPGVQEMAHQIVGLRCRVGVPTRLESLPETLRSPGWACAAGLVMYANRLAYRPSGGRSRERDNRPVQSQEQAA